MPQPKISSLFKTRKRFLRSAHLERDFRDPSALDGYIITPEIQRSLDRLSTGLNPKSGQRAWRITGDYGSGKSSFALLLAHAFAGKDSDLPPQIRRSIDLAAVKETHSRLLPVLITGSRDPLALAVLRGLAKALDDKFEKRAHFRCLSDMRTTLARAPERITDEVVLGFIRQANSEVIAKNHCTGLLIIIDELGKFLEFSAQHPERQDVFFLQELAETAARSGKEPLFMVGLLHQGFHAYADQLSPTAQREWEKVAGRFEEVLFDQPLEQITHLIGAALNVTDDSFPRGWASTAVSSMRTAIDYGWFGSAPPISSLTAGAKAIFPLHPTVIPVLVKLFSRFGQNERSLFSFLLAGEPFGLQSFSDIPATLESVYRVHNLYDYAATTFGHRLGAQSYRNHWNHIDSLVRSFPSANTVEVAVLKTVGLLNLIGSPDLVPTEESLILAIANANSESESAVRTVIHRLHKEKHVLYHRGKSGGYCVWSHTSVNLDAVYEEAGRVVGMARRVTGLIKERVDSRPIVARRHYIQTGNLRHFEVLYCSVLELDKIATSEGGKADGRIIIPLCESAEEVHLVSRFATDFRDRLDTIIGITEPLGSLASLIREVERWTWIQKNTPELKDDRYAAEEVARQLQVTTQTLEKRVHHYVGLKQASKNKTSVRWFYDGAEMSRIRTASEFISFLSDLSDGLYNRAPHVHNELVNRRVLSSAAAAGRMRLLERMLTQANRELLGMDPTKKPPEMSIYLSVLAESKVHRRKGDNWVIAQPDPTKDPCRLLPALIHIRQILDSRPDERVNVESIFEELRRAPFGVRDGLLPILLVIVLTEYQREIALYENGTFVSHVGPEEILRLSKRPAVFELQFCRLKGVRLAVFEDLLGILSVENASRSKARLLDIVRPLCVFVAELPQYARTTANLSDNARRVRDVILSAREPGTLLFKDLPRACGFEPFTLEARSTRKEATAKQFARTLKMALEELRMAFPRLKDRIRAGIASTFELPSGLDQAFRDSLEQRAENLLVSLRDLDLKAFCLRVMDSNLPEPEWLESVGSFLASTPPSLWKDGDEAVFKEKLQEMVHKFLRVESVLFSRNGTKSGDSLFRIALTTRDGQERDQVVRLTGNEKHEGQALEKDLARLLSKNTRVSTYALSRLAWKLLGGDDDRNQI
jgi:hypothetical protein